MASRLKRITITLMLACLFLSGIFALPKVSASSSGSMNDVLAESVKIGGSLSNEDPLSIRIDKTEGYILPSKYSLNSSTGIASYEPQYSIDKEGKGGSGVTISYKVNGANRNYGIGYKMSVERLDLRSMKMSADKTKVVSIYRDKLSEIELTQTVQYYSGLSYYDVIYSVQNITTNKVIDDVRIYRGGATRIDGSDFMSKATYDPMSDRLTASAISGQQMYMKGVTTPKHYQAGKNDITKIIANSDLPDTLVSAVGDSDTGYYMQWSESQIAVGGIMTVKLIEGIQKASYISVVGGETKTVAPSSTVQLEFDLSVKEAGVYTVSAKSLLSNAVTIHEMGGKVELSADTIYRVKVSVDIADYVPKAVIDIISLSVVSETQFYTASAETALDINGLSPNIIDPEFVYDFDSATQIVKTLTINFTPINIQNDTELTAEILTDNKQSFSPKKITKLAAYGGGSVSMKIDNANIKVSDTDSYYVQIKIKGYENIDLTMKIENVPISGVKITKAPSLLYTGNKAQLKAVCMPTTSIKNDLVWTVDDESCSIDKNGMLTVGNTARTITVTATNLSGTPVTASASIRIEQGIDTFLINGLPEANGNGIIEVERAKVYNLIANYAPSDIISKDMIQWSFDGEGADFIDGQLSIGHNAPVGGMLSLSAYPSTNPEKIIDLSIKIIENKQLSDFNVNLNALDENAFKFSQIAVLNQLYLDYDAMPTELKMHITQVSHDKMARLRQQGESIKIRINGYKSDYINLKAKADQGSDKLIPNKQEFETYKATLDAVNKVDPSMFAELRTEYNGISEIVTKTTALYGAAMQLKNDANALFNSIDEKDGFIMPYHTQIKELLSKMGQQLQSQIELYLFERNKVRQLSARLDEYAKILADIDLRIDNLGIFKNGIIIEEGLISKRENIVALREHILSVCNDPELAEKGSISINDKLVPAFEVLNSLVSEVESTLKKIETLIIADADALLENNEWINLIKAELESGDKLSFTVEQKTFISAYLADINTIIDNTAEEIARIGEIDRLADAFILAYESNYQGVEGIIKEKANVLLHLDKYNSLSIVQKKYAKTANITKLNSFRAQINVLTLQIDELYAMLYELDIYSLDGDNRLLNDDKLIELYTKNPSAIAEVKVSIEAKVRGGSYTNEQLDLISNGVIASCDAAAERMQILIDSVIALQSELDSKITDLENHMKVMGNSLLEKRADYRLIIMESQKLTAVQMQYKDIGKRLAELTRIYNIEYEVVAALEKSINNIRTTRGYITGKTNVTAVINKLGGDFTSSWNDPFTGKNWKINRHQFDTLKEKKEELNALLNLAEEAESDVIQRRIDYASYVEQYMNANETTGQYVVKPEIKPTIISIKTDLLSKIAEFDAMPVEKKERLEKFYAAFTTLKDEIVAQENDVYGYIAPYINDGYISENADGTWSITNVDGIIALEAKIVASRNALDEVTAEFNDEQKKIANRVNLGLSMLIDRIAQLSEQLSNKDKLHIDKLKNLNIWVRDTDGNILDTNGNIVDFSSYSIDWQFIPSKEGLYSAWSSVAYDILRDIVGLTLEQRSMMITHRQSQRIKEEYEKLKRAVANEVSIINSLNIYSNGKIVREGLIAKRSQIQSSINKIKAFTSEQKAELGSLQSRLSDCINTIVELGNTITENNTLINSCYMGGNIDIKGLIIKRRDIEKFRDLYNGGSLTEEQKNSLSVNFSKIPELLSKISELESQVLDYRKKINDIVMRGQDSDDGILALSSSVNELIADIRGTLTEEQRKLLGLDNDKNALYVLRDRIAFRTEQVVYLRAAYNAVIGQADDGLIARLNELELLVSDISNVLKYTPEQLGMLREERLMLAEKLATARELKKQVDEIIRKSERGELYVKNRYGDKTNDEIAKIVALIAIIENYTNEQQQLLNDILTAARADKTHAEELKAQIKELFERAAELDVWKGLPPHFEDMLYPQIDSEKIMDANDSLVESLGRVRSMIAQLENSFTTEQRMHINDTYSQLQIAEDMLAEFITVKDTINEYRSIKDLTYDELMDNVEKINNLYAQLRALSISNKQDMLTTVETFLKSITEQNNQVLMLLRMKKEIELYGDNVLSIKNDLLELKSYLNKTKEFSNGKKITDAQLNILAQSNVLEMVDRKINQYNSLVSVVNGIINDYKAIGITPDNLFSKRTAIEDIMDRINSKALTLEQLYMLQGVKSDCEVNLLEIAELDREISRLRDAILAIDSSVERLLSNKSEIARLNSQINRLSTAQKVYLSNEILIITQIMQKISDLETAVSEVKQRISSLKNTQKNEIIFIGNDLTSVQNEIEAMTAEQQALLELEKKYLGELFAEFNKQNSELKQLIADINSLPVSPSRDDYSTVIAVKDRYDAYIHKSLIDEETTKYLMTSFAALKDSNLTDNSTGVSVDFGTAGVIDEKVVLSSSVASKDSSMHAIYQTKLMDMDLANYVNNIYEINLKKNSIIYHPTDTSGAGIMMEVKLKLPTDFKEGSKLIFVGLDGTMKEISYEVKNGFMVFSVDTLGTFLIASNIFIFPTMWVSIGIAVIFVLVILIVFINFKMKKAKLALEYDNGTVKITIISPKKQIRNLAIYTNGVLIEQHNNPSMVYYIDGVEDRTKITVYYDFIDQKTRFPRYITKAPTLKSASKIVKI